MSLIQLFCLLLSTTTQLPVKELSDINKQSVGTIEQVAASYIEVLLQTNDWYLFRLDLPAQAVLADHLTGPRVIILLTDLSGQRLEDDSPITAQAQQSFYLENTFSKGFKNTANTTASYLVMPVMDSKPVHIFNSCRQHGFNLMLSKSPIRVCQSQQEMMFSQDSDVVWYSQQLSLAKLIPAQQQQIIGAGDLIFEFATAVQR